VKLNSGFWPVFRRVLDRTFHHDFHLPGVRVSRGRACQSEVPVFEALSFIECVRGVLHL
jgi:hypothetical protein